MADPFRNCTTTRQPGLTASLLSPDGELTLAFPDAFQVRIREAVGRPFLVFRPLSGPARWGDLRSILTPPAPPAEDSPGSGQMASFLFADGTVLEIHVPHAIGSGGGEGFNGVQVPNFVLRRHRTILNKGPIKIGVPKP